MAVYMLFIREDPIRDQAAMESYRGTNRQGPRDPNMKVLSAYGAIEAIEGKAPDGIVMLQFPTVEDAKAWYHSPSYQAAMQHRLKAADYRVMIVQGL